MWKGKLLEKEERKGSPIEFFVSPLHEYLLLRELNLRVLDCSFWGFFRKTFSDTRKENEGKIE